MMLSRSLLILAAAVVATTARAQEAAKHAPDMAFASPAEVKKLLVHPAEPFKLIGSDQSRQLIVTGVVGSDAFQDLTGNAAYTVADKKIARVTSSGRVIPLANGSTTITAKYGNSHTAATNVVVESMDADLPINFANHIVPIFSKLGCNSGGCHGKSGGQNGFALSLFGFVPELDFQTLVKENRGRRLFPASPDSSLLLLKATGLVAHAGGKRLDVSSEEYKLIRRWIASGTPFGSDTDPVVTKITIFPEGRIIGRNHRQQFAVTAHYSDGSTVDVTTRAQYESNDPDLAFVDGTGLVRTLDLAGEAAVMARYLGQVATFRATIPLGVKIPNYTFAKQTLVDTFTEKKWRELGLVPSDLAADEVFLRRVTLDITGTLPTPDQIKSFLADNDPKKRNKLIDALLETPEYSYFAANRWADILRVKRGNNNNNQGISRATGTFAFHGWIRDSLAQDKPYDQFVREILTAVGDEIKSPPTFWYRDLVKPEQFVDDACQVFLGVRMACAQCHHHPYEKWSQDDYWSFAAYFAQLGRKNVPAPSLSPQNQNLTRQIVYHKGTGTVTNPRTNKAAPLKALDSDDTTPATPGMASSGDDPRLKLAEWMSSPKNPYFAKAVVNRTWAHFLGKGIVDPVDDMRVTNPPSNPELLDALAKDFVEHGYSLKHLVRMIAKSRTYQLSAAPNEFNKNDKKSYARFYPRRMQAEVLFDAVSQVTGTPATFTGMPTDRFAPNRAIMLPDESYASYFLDVFGRPQRISACECERVTEANLAQSLHLLNSTEVQNKLAKTDGRAAQLAKDQRPDAEKVDELFLWALGRLPSRVQRDLALQNIELNAKDKRIAYENIIWALINAKEFILTQ